MDMMALCMAGLVPDRQAGDHPHVHVGEGAYAETEREIETLLSEQ